MRCFLLRGFCLGAAVLSASSLAQAQDPVAPAETIRVDAESVDIVPLPAPADAATTTSEPLTTLEVRRALEDYLVANPVAAQSLRDLDLRVHQIFVRSDLATTGELQVRLPDGYADAVAAETLKDIVRSSLAPFVAAPAAALVPVAAYDPNVTPPLVSAGFVRLASVGPAPAPGVPTGTALQSSGVVGPPLPFAGAYYEGLVLSGRIAPVQYATYQPWTASYVVPAWAPASFGAPASYGVPASYSLPGTFGVPSVPCGCSSAAVAPTSIAVP